MSPSRPSTPVREARPPLDNIVNVLHETPRKHKSPAATWAETEIPQEKGPTPWPRCKHVVTEAEVALAVQNQTGKMPRDWQMQAGLKPMQGEDVFVVARTGAGKSLIFMVTAMAARLAGLDGCLIVVSPLKTLQNDQVTALNAAADEYERREATNGTKLPGVRAICVNEDSNGPDVFEKLENGKVQICYASPEILLKHQRFKKLFRQERFRTSVPAIFVDEAHVISEWKDEFRRSYADLEDLLTLCGTRTPCGAFTASAPTDTFEVVYSTLKMGVNRPVFVLDVGSDRPNIEYNIQAMEHGITSARDVLSFLPKDPIRVREDLKKHIIYLPTRELCIRATLLLRHHVPEHQLAFWPFFATCSEGYKERIFRDFKENTGTVRWLLATSAAGMGLDVADIDVTGSLGNRKATQVYQEAGRAVRNARLHGKWIWLVPRWMIEPNLEGHEDSLEKEKSRTAAKEREMREKADSGAIELVRASRDCRCLRSVLVKYFRPTPAIPGFPGQKVIPEGGHKVTYKCIDLIDPFPPVPTCCSSCVRSGRGQVATSTALPATSTVNAPPAAAKPTTTKRSCSKANKDKLRNALQLFRAARWKEIRITNPFLDHEWILSDTSITHILAKAHVLLSTPTINETLIRDIARNPEVSVDNVMLLIDVLVEFCKAVDKEEEDEKQVKTAKKTKVSGSQTTISSASTSKSDALYALYCAQNPAPRRKAGPSRRAA